MALLPAASEALALKGNNLVKKYVIHSYRYLLIVLLPICALVIILGKPIMLLLFSRAPLAYSNSGTAMSILVIGMAFFSIYGISAKRTTGSWKTLSRHVLLGDRNSNEFNFNNIISAYLWFKWSSNCNYDSFIHGYDSNNHNHHKSY